MTRLLVVLALILGTVPALAQDFATNVKSTEVAPGLLLIEGADGFAGGNMTLLIGDDRVALIDDGVEPVAPALIAIAESVAGRPVDFVINTHVHADHVGGNSAFAATGATIFAHDNIRKRLLDKPSDAGGMGGLPIVTFDDAVTFHINGLEAYVFHVEHAHTDGDAAIEFRGVNVIHAGDVFFNYLFPFIDLDNGGSVAGFVAAQKKIIAMSDDETVIIPGHGPLASKSDLQTALDVLLDCEARVKALVHAGKTEDEILAANPLADYHDTWNWGFITTERMTKTLYRSLTSN
jgi:glyoxylase-like metal-dependent hydrolase (beta-lactamase superfamily II)